MLFWIPLIGFICVTILTIFYSLRRGRVDGVWVFTVIIYAVSGGMFVGACVPIQMNYIDSTPKDVRQVSSYPIYSFTDDQGNTGQYVHLGYQGRQPIYIVKRHQGSDAESKNFSYYLIYAPNEDKDNPVKYPLAKNIQEYPKGQSKAAVVTFQHYRYNTLLWPWPIEGATEHVIWVPKGGVAGDPAK